MPEQVDIARSWTIFPIGESNKHGLPHLEIREHRSQDGVTLTIRSEGDEKDEYDESSMTLTAQEWRELTSLPVRFDEAILTQ